MEKSELAGNAVTFLHEEDYLDRLAAPILGADTWLSVAGRSPRPLDGDWHFAIDPFDTGFRQKWYAFARGAVPPVHDWNPYEGETVPVPSVWNLTAPERKLYEGGAWYARRIEDPRDRPGDRVILRIGAASYCARVFLDGRFLGLHRGGSTPFTLDLSEALDGTGELMIHVENHRRPDRLPCHHFDWFNYGGLHREVALYVLPREHLRDVFVRLGPSGGVAVDVTATSGLSEARVEIPDLGVDAAVPLADGRGARVIDAAPDLWAPDTPRLYDVTVTAGEDRLVERIGFRSLATSADRLLLNGEPVFLKGVCVHEDDRETGRVTSEADLRRRFAHAKDLGANFLRLAHYPHHDLAARLADEEGLMLWEELPAYWSVDFANPGTRADARNQLSELVLRDRNRASVVLWGLANETADLEIRRAFMDDLATTARTLDPTRPLAAACLFDQLTLTVEDSLTELVDVVGINEYFGWYDEDVGDLDRLLSTYDLGKPLVISETGCDVVAGREGEARNGEAFGARYYAAQIDVVKRHPHVAGFCPWLLYDFRSERRQNPDQSGWNRKGLIAEDKATRKRAFDVVRAWFGTV
jgi:beta-glucuronidase